MKKYTAKRVSDNKVLSEWKSDFADHTHYEENWGKPEHQRELTPRLRNEDGTITEATYETVASEFVIEEIDITAEVTQQKVNQDALQYLAETDCFALRLVETGKPMPIGILELRAAARLKIVK